MKQEANLPSLQDPKEVPTLNGDALKQEAQTELDKLEEDPKLQVAGYLDMVLGPLKSSDIPLNISIYY